MYEEILGGRGATYLNITPLAGAFFDLWRDDGV